MLRPELSWILASDFYMILPGLNVLDINALNEPIHGELLAEYDGDLGFHS